MLTNAPGIPGVLLSVPLMLSLVFSAQSVEEQESGLRLLVTLSSCRVSHPPLVQWLTGLSGLMAKRILYPEILVCAAHLHLPRIQAKAT